MSRFREKRHDSTQAEIDETVKGFLAEQARAASDQQRPLGRGTHAKGICVRAVFEVADLRTTVDTELARRLARGIFARPGTYPATVRFANSDPGINSDWQPDVRGLSFSLELPRPGDATRGRVRHDFSLQSAPTLPFNDLHAFSVFGRVLAARSQTVGLASLTVEDQLVFARTQKAIVQQQRQPVLPYQRLRYWSNVPFRHGTDEVVKYSAYPLARNPAHSLDERSPNALVNELRRHVNDDAVMSAFDFGVQYLEIGRMTYEGAHRDDAFWIENASVEWSEDESPFHTVARLTLVPDSVLTTEECERQYIDVNEYSSPEHAPLGAINRARRRAELASRQARLQA